MRLSLYSPIVSSLCLLSFSCVAPAFAGDYSFSEAWQRLLSVNNSVVAEKEATARAQAKKDATKHLYGPQVKLSAHYLYLDDDVELEPNDILEHTKGGKEFLANGMQAGLIPHIPLDALNSAFTTTLAEQDTLASSLSAVWPIYAGGRINAAQDIAGAQYHEALAHEHGLIHNQFAELAKRYFGVVFLEQVYQTRLKVEAGLDAHLKKAYLLEREGQIAKVERLQAQASRDKARVDRKSAENDLEIARRSLATILADNSEPIPVDSLFINNEIEPLQYFIDKSLKNFAGLKVLGAKKDQAEGLVKVEKGALLPEVALLGNLNIYEDESLTTELAPDWFVGMSVSFTLHDRHGRLDKIDAAHSSVRQAEALIDQAKEDIALLSEKYYRTTIQAREEYNGLHSSIALAQESVTLRQKAFGQGLGTSLDVVDAELFLAGMQIGQAKARYNYVVALSHLLSLGGDLDGFAHYQEQAIR